MLGYHTEQYDVRYNDMYRENFPNNELDDMNAGATATQTNSGFTCELAMLSYFGRVNYDYAGKYLLEANFRSDASSRFAPGHRWGYFPSFSAAWRISEESFMENTRDWLNSLKIRGSWGMLGNQDALSDGTPTGGDLKYVDTNGDGKITAEDRELYKTKDPVMTFGLNLNAGYKNFDLTLNFTGAANVGFAYTKEAFGEFSGSAGHPSTAWLDSWTPENKNASMPRVAEARMSPSEASVVFSDFWVMNTSYLRLKTAQLGYTFPKGLLEKAGIQNLRVYYSAENLLTFDSMPLNVDPETVSTRLSSYPLSTTHSFGVNVTF